MQEYFLVFSAELHFVTGTDFAAYEFTSWVPIIFCLGACLLVFCSHTIHPVQLFGFAFYFQLFSHTMHPSPPKKKQLSKQTPSSLTQICETKMQASGQQISMLNFCKLVMECYVGQSVTCCRQKLTRTCTCCIFVICILFGCMLFQQCPICLGWRSEIESQQKHAFAKACVFLSILL